MTRDCCLTPQFNGRPRAAVCDVDDGDDNQKDRRFHAMTFPCRLTPQFSGGALRVVARREHRMK
jgi:hypothetical protein